MTMTFEREKELEYDFKADGLTLEGLNQEQTKIAKVVLKVLKNYHPGASGHGCKAFRTPKYHKDHQGEQFGHGAALILVHDGGDLAPFCSYDYGCYSLIDALDKELEKEGYYKEQCTTWYTAVYKI